MTKSTTNAPVADAIRAIEMMANNARLPELYRMELRRIAQELRASLPKMSTTNAPTPYRVVNLDHHNTLPGGVGMPHDRAVVLSTTETEPHPLTGKAQPKQLFPAHGVCSLAEANEWVRASLPTPEGR